jgi:hypothetical protein
MNARDLLETRLTSARMRARVCATCRRAAQLAVASDATAALLAFRVLYFCASVRSGEPQER